MSCALVVGGGGREHALAWALSRSKHVERLIAAPGNPGIAACNRAENAPIAAGDIAGLVELCRRESVDLAVVGPEGPLAAGLVDALVAARVAAVGPDASCARLEASKAHCKQFLLKNRIPTAAAHIFRNAGEALRHLDARPDVPVVKASGLAAGKGVVVPETKQEAAATIEAMLVGGRFGAAGSEILLEERLEGRELSVLAFCDGERFAVLPPAQDHKRLLEGDRGPNTGGMGAVAPSPAADRDLIEAVCERIIAPTLTALRRAGTPYRGVLYAGLMLTHDGPKVIEFNCRFGDPEAQAVIPLLCSDLYEIMLACATGSLDGVAIDWAPEACVAVVMASAGYPDGTAMPGPIAGLDGAAGAGCVVFHAGTGTIEGGLHATGGRGLAGSAVGPGIEAAGR
ncbi:MAG: phosphoribosylamine--glycine ligase, partial [Acidimicrobiaceae bacterium]|nr:phosphoribosylamine--glycine ligase [Acidimicrobiaceae bacterium]